MVWSKYRRHESFWGAELQSQHLARDSMYLQPSSLVVHEAEIHYDASADPRPPKQPGNDIDVYLRPLVDELLQLWAEPGVRVWDEHKQEEFDLRALLFVTINDWPALSNISGQTNKGYSACTHCLDETESIYLDKCRKNVYPYNRRFLRARRLHSCIVRDVRAEAVACFAPPSDVRHVAR